MSRLRILKDCLLILFFQIDETIFNRLGHKHFIIGLLLVWIVGMGRHWDDAQAGLLQQLGLGSVLYIFVLAAFLWIFIWPLRPANWSYYKLLIFISLTAPPALVYAMPVELWLSETNAVAYNFVALAIVSVWRVGLLVSYLRLVTRFNFIKLFTALALPIFSLLWVLGFIHVLNTALVVMGGIREMESSTELFINSVVHIIMTFSMVLLPILLILYLILILDGFLKRKFENNGTQSS